MTDLTQILIIEDDPMDATLLRLSLERSLGNYEIKRARRLSVGVEAARSKNHSVIVTDLGLPDSEGLEAVEHLRFAAPDAAIIVVSGQDNEELYIDALSYGADAVLSKNDVSPVTIHRCIQQSIARCKQKAENQRLIRAVQDHKARLQSQAVELADKNERLEKLCATSHDFVNNVSHEFRTPLCVVKQYASLIADGVVGSVTEEQRGMLRVIEGRVDDLNNIVDDMLDISRHESGLLAASRECSDAAEIVARIVPGLSQRAKLRQIEIRCEVSEGLPEIYCDPEKVSRTLINLIVNAIKFSSPGCTVVVSVSHCPTNREVNFAVKDSGPGIEAEQREMIFARFRQVNSTLQSSTKGFGLGLNIAKELVDLNLGEMSLQSVVGEGSTFSFSVPVNDPWEVSKRFVKRLVTIRGSRKTRVFAIKATIDNHGDLVRKQETHVFLNYLLNSQDLLIPLASGEWMIMMNAESSEVKAFFDNAMKEVVRANRNRPQGPLPDVKLKFEAEFDLEDGVDALKTLFSSDAAILEEEPAEAHEVLINAEGENLVH